MYDSYVKRMREWATATGVDTEDDTVNIDPEFVLAFTGAPKKCSPEALTLYLTYKCLTETRRKSTAEGAHAAMKKYWEEL